MNEEQISLINHRRQKAKTTLNDAFVLFENNGLASCVNRIYYSMFYEVTALLLTDDLASSKHSGVISFFQKEYIKKNIVDKEMGKFYKEMFELRQISDYGDYIEFENANVQKWLLASKKFIDVIEILIENRIT